MTEEEQIRAAVRLAQDPLFAHIVERLHNDAVSEWASSAPTDQPRRERCYYQQLAIAHMAQEVYSLANKAKQK